MVSILIPSEQVIERKQEPRTATSVKAKGTPDRLVLRNATNRIVDMDPASPSLTDVPTMLSQLRDEDGRDPTSENCPQGRDGYCRRAGVAHMLIIVIVAVAGEFLIGVLVGGILHSFSGAGSAAASGVIPFPPRGPREGLHARMPLEAAEVGYPDGDAA